MRAGAAFSFAGLLLGATACATSSTMPVMRLGTRIKAVRIVQGPLALNGPKIWDQMGLAEQPTIITDSDPIVPPLYRPPAPPPVAQAAAEESSCRRAAVTAERRHQLPHGLLSAIAFTESSMIPTALRVDGRPLYPKSRTEAEQIADQALGQRLSVMAGCMQVNLQVHDRSGASWALDPMVASNWAAEYLWELYDRLGSWASAISAYGGSRTTNNYLYRVMQNLQTVENDPSYVQLASYAPAGLAVAGCRTITDGAPGYAGGGAGCQSDDMPGDLGGAGRKTAAETDAFPQFAKPTASFRSGCWNLPEWLNGHAGACNAASAAKLRADAVVTDGESTVRLGGPEGRSQWSPVRHVALVRPAAPSPVMAAVPHLPVHRTLLPPEPRTPASPAHRYASGWPFLAISPNRSPTKRKPRFSRAKPRPR